MRTIASSVQFILLFLIIAASTFFMVNAARNDSAIFDETAHIVAGYTYLKHSDYRFNPEHPPLVKMLAAVPLLFQKLNFPTDTNYWTGINEQWAAGGQFLYESGNNADQIIFWARLGPILITIGLLIFTYYWSQKLIGRWSALLPVFLLAFSPLVLAHGHYVTTDIGATLGMMLSIYFFLKFLFKPSLKNLILAGLIFGFAQAIKFSSLLLLPSFFTIALVFCALAAKKGTGNSVKRFLKFGVALGRLSGKIILLILIGYAAVVYPLYLISTWNYPVEKQVSDTQAIIGNFGIGPLAELNIKMAQNKILRPFAEYLLGVLMVLQRSAGGNNAYFLGELSANGWWYYFPLIYLMKESLPAIMILMIGFFLGTSRIVKTIIQGFKKTKNKFLEYLRTNFTEFSMLIFIAIYWVSSVTSPLNIGARHILPTIPFFYILAAGAIKKWLNARPIPISTTAWERFINFIHNLFSAWVKTAILGVLISWILFETIIASPYFLSYFNEFAGGRNNGYRYAVDSNFDWGQDLKRLKIWTEKNLPPEEKIAVDYFGGGNPKYYLGEKLEPWWSGRGNPKDENIGWLAVSVNTLQGATGRPSPDFYRNPADEYRWLKEPYQPFNRAGKAIFIYKL